MIAAVPAVLPFSPGSLQTVVAPREKFIGNSVGVALEPSLHGPEALVEVVPDRASVPHRRNEHADDERDQRQAET